MCCRQKQTLKCIRSVTLLLVVCVTECQLALHYYNHQNVIIHSKTERCIQVRICYASLNLHITCMGIIVFSKRTWEHKTSNKYIHTQYSLPHTHIKV